MHENLIACVYYTVTIHFQNGNHTYSYEPIHHLPGIHFPEYKVLNWLLLVQASRPSLHLLA